MKTPLKLKHMETGEIIIAGLSVLTTLSGTGIFALIRQGKKNTELEVRVKHIESKGEEFDAIAHKAISFEERLIVVEDERAEIHEIKKEVTEIRIINARYFTILESNQKSLESVVKSVNRIHSRIDIIETKKD